MLKVISKILCLHHFFYSGAVLKYIYGRFSNCVYVLILLHISGSSSFSSKRTNSLALASCLPFHYTIVSSLKSLPYSFLKVLFLRFELIFIYILLLLAFLLFKYTIAHIFHSSYFFFTFLNIIIANICPTIPNNFICSKFNILFLNFALNLFVIKDSMHFLHFAILCLEKFLFLLLFSFSYSLCLPLFM